SLSVVTWQLFAQNPPINDARAAAMKNMRAGNFKDAYNELRRIALDPKNGGSEVGEDLQNAIQCLYRLGRATEVDEFREGVIAKHAENWRLLFKAADTYMGGENYG